MVRNFSLEKISPLVASLRNRALAMSMLIFESPLLASSGDSS